MKYKLATFFSGRNGFDELARLLLWTSLILMTISIFVPVAWLSSLMYVLSFAGLTWSYVRCFSKKLDKRQAENDAYLSWRSQLKQRWTQRKTHRFFRCRKCKTLLRVPKGKGKIAITCKCCGEKLIRKT